MSHRLTPNMASLRACSGPAERRQPRPLPRRQTAWWTRRSKCTCRPSPGNRIADWRAPRHVTGRAESQRPLKASGCPSQT